MTKKQKETITNSFDYLRALIAEYVQAAIDESWAGGGDPLDVDSLKLAERLAREKLNSHIVKMERDHG